MSLEIIATIISGILIVVSSLFGGGYKKWKKKATVGINLLNEVKKAYQDNKITTAELKRIIDKYENLVK